MPKPTIDLGIFAAHTTPARQQQLDQLIRKLITDIQPLLEEASGATWNLQVEEPNQLATDEPHRPTDFLSEASLRMVEGPYDIVVVVTDVGIVSSGECTVPGLASPVSRMAVLSTRRLLLTEKGEPLREVGSEEVRWNAGNLLLHLIGHIMRLEHEDEPDTVMSPYHVRTGLSRLLPFSQHSQEKLRRRVEHLPEHEHTGSGWAGRFGFQLQMALRHPQQVLRPVLRSKALLLPLSLPGLATAAVAPTFILVFTAEIWDVGLHMSDVVAWSFAAAAIIAATLHMTNSQNLYFPREDKRTLTEHMAIVNASIFLIILLAVIGLFIMVGLLMLVIEFYVFPPDLISTWPTLQDPEVTVWDKIRLAAFMSTVGVLTGALAGGLESRNVIRHLALFKDEV